MEVVVRNQHTRETELCESGSIQISKGQLVVMDSRYGLDLGEAIGTVRDGSKGAWRDKRALVRVATDDDLTAYRAQEEEARAAEAVCRERIEEHKLDMRLVSAHMLLDRSKLLFFFTAEHRVDFRALVRDLVSRFHTRIELRQIGVRDETRILGGIGVCGRQLCCNGVSDRLAPVSIRMAKNQNYSLNSMKVSGPCGRLLCCLAYENDFYERERRRFPQEGSPVSFDNADFRVQEINVLSQNVRISAMDGRNLVLPVDAFEPASSRGGGGGASGRRAWVVNADRLGERTEADID